METIERSTLPLDDAAWLVWFQHNPLWPELMTIRVVAGRTEIICGAEVGDGGPIPIKRLDDGCYRVEGRFTDDRDDPQFVGMAVMRMGGGGAYL